MSLWPADDLAVAILMSPSMSTPPSSESVSDPADDVRRVCCGTGLGCMIVMAILSVDAVALGDGADVGGGSLVACALPWVD
jgi:hypothetical protein